MLLTIPLMKDGKNQDIDTLDTLTSAMMREEWVLTIRMTNACGDLGQESTKKKDPAT